MIIKGKNSAARKMSKATRSDFAATTHSTGDGDSVELVGVVPPGYESAEQYADSLGLAKTPTDTSRYNKLGAKDFDLGC